MHHGLRNQFIGPGWPSLDSLRTGGHEFEHRIQNKDIIFENVKLNTRSAARPTRFRIFWHNSKKSKFAEMSLEKKEVSESLVCNLKVSIPGFFGRIRPGGVEERLK
jgi:hypothetical protein